MRLHSKHTAGQLRFKGMSHVLAQRQLFLAARIFAEVPTFLTRNSIVSRYRDQTEFYQQNPSVCTVDKIPILFYSVRSAPSNCKKAVKQEFSVSAI